MLEPNYRGSAGYGAKFRALNVRNLGIGDAWDVLSGIDFLVAQGLVDRDRVGSMGWSQGGYISAFLTTRHADRFRAISVGAGISDWMTYYVNTDIHPFTRQYLKATPWDDPKIYADTSPMTYIKQAKTPTLIQHGDQDAARAGAERLPALSGPTRPERAGAARAVQGLRARPQQAKGQPRGDGAELGVLREAHLGRRHEGHEVDTKGTKVTKGTKNPEGARVFPRSSSVLESFVAFVVRSYLIAENGISRIGYFSQSL